MTKTAPEEKTDFFSSTDSVNEKPPWTLLSPINFFPFYRFFKNNFYWVLLIYNAVLVSAVQQSGVSYAYTLVAHCLDYFPI